MTTERPRTIEQFRALPEGPAFGLEEHPYTDHDRDRGYILVRGRRINIVVGCSKVAIPVAPDVVAFHSEEADMVSFTDDKGCWLLGRYADGTWFRQRR